jgi:uncharacterized protein GlcG (DUF336 family)
MSEATPSGIALRPTLTGAAARRILDAAVAEASAMSVGVAGAMTGAEDRHIAEVALERAFAR